MPHDSRLMAGACLTEATRSENAVLRRLKLLRKACFLGVFEYGGVIGCLRQLIGALLRTIPLAKEAIPGTLRLQKHRENSFGP